MSRVVLVTGGSQGAKALNTVVPQALALLRQPVQVLPWVAAPSAAE